MTYSDTIVSAIFMHFNGIEEELEATFDITVEEYPAEPYSWGGSRGTETEVTARLLSWHRHGQEFTRSDATALIGDSEVSRQEEWTASAYEHDRFAA